MSVEQNKQLYRRFIQGGVQRGQDRARARFCRAQLRRAGSPDGITHIVTMFRTGFPDLNIVIEELIESLVKNDVPALMAQLGAGH